MDEDAIATDPEDERHIELSAIQAIFPELILDPSHPFSASIQLPVSPWAPLAVIFLPLAGGARAIAPSKAVSPGPGGHINDFPTKDSPELEIKYLSHLPPLKIQIKLPDGYPASVPPSIRLESESDWLAETKLEELRTAGISLWEENGHNQVIYDFVDYIQQQASSTFNLVRRGGSALEVPQKLELALLDFDLKAKRALFDQETFTCGVCLVYREPKKGAVCHQLQSCSHVFCGECLRDFYNACINEGDIANVKCLAPGCGKDDPKSAPSVARRKHKRRIDRTLEPNELLEIPLESTVVQRYVKLKRKNHLESNKHTIYCPRKWCQGPAKSKSRRENATSSDDDDEEPKDDQDDTIVLPPPSDRLAVCEDCSFAFCSVCKTGWHGEFARCFPRRQHELSAEEKATEEYLQKHSTRCPTCDARAQKTMGCNHMICFKCNTHFCYLCSSWLSEENPYVHFNTTWTPCFQRLWELEDGDGAGVERRDVPAPPPVQIIFEDDEPEGIPPAGIPPAAPHPPPLQPQGHPERQGRRINGIRVNARAMEGLVRGRREPPVRPEQDQALQRFLRLAAEDEEDEWDSDASEDNEQWAIHW